MKDDHKKDQQIFQSLAMIMQFGINMLVPIFACTLFGAWLGDKLNLSWLALPFFAVGALAGMRNVFLFARRIYQPDSKKTVKNTIKQEKDEGDV
jgi:hypothetical protein